MVATISIGEENGILQRCKKTKEQNLWSKKLWNYYEKSHKLKGINKHYQQSKFSQKSTQAL